MKTFNLLFSAIIAVLVSISANAQTVDQSHKKITEHHTGLHKKHEALNSGTVKDHKQHTKEVGSQLDSAKKHHGELYKKMSDQDKTKTQEHHDAIKKHHASAAAHHKAMQEEASKPNPDQTKMKTHSKNIDTDVTEADKHHSEIKKKTGKQ
jgi:hypothetical protein